LQGFAESYMLGEVTSPDLTKFFEVSSIEYRVYAK
jgi:hypothetical protein